ncbi:acyl-CoA reductase-like NAD-dependent aldehyde dehydrogenase/Zn-dependent alcohol dehydrogenase [Aurantimicrobium minutum]|uniref:aldehyde dehydrogenase family protein n=1 Tax=Aurantimicrobium minutum TaxID=708131 RepID=UPI002473B7B8|nr:aldehyde dehydrogenase family protein [Aurantimicrobium minutum]MDH6532573.1 acyl-CoA reductase-like NAD-dependent aldehyde dehydrogenase/Zn-dependent alcohol dehydrogenase [Aurantimicrobium minutum]
MIITAAVTPAKSAPFVLETLELDDLRDDEVLVQMVASGVCHTDANVREQYLPTPLPAVLGHEGSGVVKAIGSAVRSVKIGDHVLLSVNSCGSCEQCLKGNSAYCLELFSRNFGGSRPDGTTSLTGPKGRVSSHFFGQSSFATFSNVPERCIVVVDKDIDLRKVAPLGCGVQTGAGTVFNELVPKPGSTLAVFGSGAVGFGAIMAAIVAGCKQVIAVDINDSRLELAREVGATHTINSRIDPVHDRIMDMTHGRGIDFAIDTTGRPDVLRIAADSLAVKGTVALVGASPAGTEVPFEIGESLIKGWTFKTVIQGGSVPQNFIPGLINLWRQGRFPFDKLIKFYELADINTAIHDAEKGNTIKPVVVFDQVKTPPVVSAREVTELNASETEQRAQATYKGENMSKAAVADIFGIQNAQHLIGGEWVSGGVTVTSTNPATDEILGSFQDADDQIVDQAINSAFDTFHASSWRTDRNLRARALWDLADAFERNFDRLALAITTENGKPLREAQFEVSLCAPKLRYYASMALTDLGTSMVTPTGDVAMSLKEPIGVAGIIVPWNSPVILAVRSFAPALAAGCTAAIKMPGQTALTGALMMDIISKVESLPAGVLNFFTESRGSGARTLVSSPKTPVISYTGSTQVGRQIGAAAGGMLKRSSLELGGKTPMIVFSDANLDVAVPTLTAGVSTFAGQFCMTGSRILVHEDIAEELADKLSGSLSSLKLGAGVDPETQLGPLIDHAQVQRLNNIIDHASDADVILRGGYDGPGAFMRPTILGVQDLNSSLIQEEIFGPVATFETFSTEEEAIARANATEFGLAASVWTSDGARSLRMSNALEAGTVWTNSWAVVLDQFEEGGFKSSGIGRLNGPTGLAEFQEHKHVFRTAAF